jgi:hypothetical protein
MTERTPRSQSESEARTRLAQAFDILRGIDAGLNGPVPSVVIPDLWDAINGARAALRKWPE